MMEYWNGGHKENMKKTSILNTLEDQIPQPTFPVFHHSIGETVYG